MGSYLASKIDELFLEVKLNGEIFTILRNLNKPSARLSIFTKKFEEIRDSEEPAIIVNPGTQYSDFLLDSLKIPNLSLPLTSKPGAKPTSITFLYLMRILYMDQENSFQSILFRVQPEWLKGKLVEILLGIAEEEIEELRNRIQELTNRIDTEQREIRSITEFLIGSGANQVELHQLRAESLEKRDQLMEEIRQTKANMRGGKGLTDNLRNKLDTINTKISRFQEERVKIEFKIQDFLTLRNSLMVDQEKIRKISDATYILSSVDFTKCPRCLQHITSSMREKENDGHCMLCSRPFLSEMQGTRILDKNDIVEDEIVEVQMLVEKYENELSKIAVVLENLLAQKSNLQVELDEKSADYVSPFVDSLERLLYDLNLVEADIELCDQQLSQWDQVKRREDQVKKLQDERNQARVRVNEMDTGDDTKVRKFSDYYEVFLKNVGDQDMRTARIDPKTMMPIINGNPYTEDVGSGMQSVRTIAYHYSLLQYSINEESYYPRFLMLDSPRQFDLNPGTYERLLLQFHNLGINAQDRTFQVILTTRDLPHDMEEYVIERLNHVDRMLLRPKESREQSSFPRN